MTQPSPGASIPAVKMHHPCPGGLEDGPATRGQTAPVHDFEGIPIQPQCPGIQAFIEEPAMIDPAATWATAADLSSGLKPRNIVTHHVQMALNHLAGPTPTLPAVV